MSQLLARIMLAIFMLPSAAVIHAITFAALMNMSGWSWQDRFYFSWFMAGFVTWVVIACWWIRTWQSSVCWTWSRKLWTFLAAVGAIIIAGAVGLLIANIDDEFGMMIFTLSTPMIWLPLTVLIWRETAAERALRVAGQGNAIVCPTCGYNLTGLKSLRCPECGTSFTLDDLYARQPSQAAVELDRA